MTIHALVTGVLHKEVVQRISQNGHRYVTCTVRTEQEGQSIWINVICFDDIAQETLMKLNIGDALSLQGKATPKVYIKDDEPRPSLHLTASQVLALQPKYEPRQASKPKSAAKAKPAAKTTTSTHTQEEAQYSNDGFDDPLDF
jgi:single-stranded DNA-binding protein